AALLRTTPLLFLDDNVWVREGETKVIPSTDGEYYIETKKFHLETYDPDDPEDAKFKESMESRGAMIHKNYQTEARIYEAKGKEVASQEPELQKIKSGSIQMNKPLKFEGYTRYQSQYQESDCKEMTFSVYKTDNEDQKSL